MEEEGKEEEEEAKIENTFLYSRSLCLQDHHWCVVWLSVNLQKKFIKRYQSCDEKTHDNMPVHRFCIFTSFVLKIRWLFALLPRPRSLELNLAMKGRRFDIVDDKANSSKKLQAFQNKLLKTCLIFTIFSDPPRGAHLSMWQYWS